MALNSIMALNVRTTFVQRLYSVCTTSVQRLYSVQDFSILMLTEETF